MKTIKNLILIIFVSTFAFTSCDSIVEDTDPKIAGNGAGDNLASFDDLRQNVSAVVDGADYDKFIKVHVKGPSYQELTEDVVVTFAADPSSTAIEGIHYEFPSMTMTLTAANDYIGLLPITLKTAAVTPPATESLKLIISAVNPNGGNVVANGEAIDLTMVYQCFADLTGTYTVTNTFCFPTFTTEIYGNPDGSWHLNSADGGWLHQCTLNTTLLNFGDITELCGDILPTGNLDFGTAGFSGAIGDITGGTWDSVNGVLEMNHTQSWSSSRPGSWSSTYTRQ